MDALTEEVKQLRDRFESIELLVLNLSKHLPVPSTLLPAATNATTTAVATTIATPIESTCLPGSVFQVEKLPIFGNCNYSMFAELHVEEDITCLTMSNNNNHITCGLNNGEIVVFDLIKVKKISVHQVNMTAPVLCLNYNRNDSMLCVCTDKIISVFSCFTYKPYEHLKNISIHDNIVSSITFTNELNMFISVSHDYTMKIYNINDNNCIHSTSSTNAITDVRYNYTNNTFVTVANNIKVYNYKNFQLIKTIESPDEIYYTASFNSAGNKLVSSGVITGTVKVWNCLTYDLLYTISLRQTSFVPVSFSRFNDQYILYCKGGNSVAFIDTSTNKIAKNIDDIEEINSVYHSDCFLSYATVDRKIKLYSII